jgi:hypothetical protein
MIGLMQRPIAGFLASVGLTPEILVEFQFNPEEISDKRAVSYASVTAPGILLPLRHYTSGGDRTLSFTVQVDGTDEGRDGSTQRISRDAAGSIIPELNKYRAFVWPQTSDWERAGATFAPLYASTQQFAAPPACRFGFGERLLDCVITEISVQETHFNHQLAPLRAKITITLVELLPYGSDLTPPPGSA